MCVNVRKEYFGLLLYFRIFTYFGWVPKNCIESAGSVAVVRITGCYATRQLKFKFHLGEQIETITLFNCHIQASKLAKLNETCVLIN